MGVYGKHISYSLEDQILRFLALETELVDLEKLFEMLYFQLKIISKYQKIHKITSRLSVDYFYLHLKIKIFLSYEVI